MLVYIPTRALRLPRKPAMHRVTIDLDRRIRRQDLILLLLLSPQLPRDRRRHFRAFVASHELFGLRLRRLRQPLLVERWRRPRVVVGGDSQVLGFILLRLHPPPEEVAGDDADGEDADGNDDGNGDEGGAA